MDTSHQQVLPTSRHQTAVLAISLLKLHIFDLLKADASCKQERTYQISQRVALPDGLIQIQVLQFYVDLAQ